MLIDHDPIHALAAPRRAQGRRTCARPAEGAGDADPADVPGRARSRGWVVRPCAVSPGGTSSVWTGARPIHLGACAAVRCCGCRPVPPALAWSPWGSEREAAELIPCCARGRPLDRRRLHPSRRCPGSLPSSPAPYADPSRPYTWRRHRATTARHPAFLRRPADRCYGSDLPSTALGPDDAQSAALPRRKTRSSASSRRVRDDPPEVRARWRGSRTRAAAAGPMWPRRRSWKSSRRSWRGRWAR